MTDIRTERARIRRALRVKVAAYVRDCWVLVDSAPGESVTDDLRKRRAKLWAIVDKEKVRLCRALRTGRAIGALTSRPRAARKAP